MTAAASASLDELTAAIRAAVAAAGQSVPALRPVRREFSRRIKQFDAKEVLDLALRLLAAGLPKWLAYELVHHHRAAMAALDVKWLTRLGDGLAAWYEVDPYACYLAGPAWREGRISDRVVHGWAKSADRWWRRVAVVSSVALNNTARGGSGDTLRTLAVCKLAVDDRDDMVVKALSWALRELAKRDPAAVRAFLRANDGRLAPRVVREVGNKLTTGLKNSRRTG